MGTYYLVYAFDKECEISLVLKQGTLEELDIFTSEFKNSEDIRRKFKKEIELFRESKKTYIEYSEKKNGIKETGDIVLHSIECSKNNQRINVRTRVLYKYHKLLLDELLQNKTLMKVFSRKCYKEIKSNISSKDSNICRLSEYESSKLSFPETVREDEYKSALNSFKKDLKKSDKYFSTMREIFNIYRELCKNDSSLISFEKLLTKHKNMMTIKNSKLKKEKPDKKTHKINPTTHNCDIEFSYDSYVDELDDLMHTDDWQDYEDSDTVSEFLEYAQNKTKR